MGMEKIAETVPARGELLVAELEEYRRQFEAVKRDARDLLAGLTDAQFNWRAMPGRWSIAECLAHLNVANQMTLQAIVHSLRKARMRPAQFKSGPFRHGLIGRMAIWAIEPPAKIKTKSPKLFTPPPEHLLAVVGPAFESVHDQLIERLHEANGLDLARVKVTSAVSRFFSISLGQSFAFIAAHDRRHLWQARQVRNDPNFIKP